MVVVVFRQFGDFVGNAEADFRVELLLEDFRGVRDFNGHVARVKFADVKDDGGLLFFAHGVLLLSIRARVLRRGCVAGDLRASLYGFNRCGQTFVVASWAAR